MRRVWGWLPREHIVKACVTKSICAHWLKFWSLYALMIMLTADAITYIDLPRCVLKTYTPYKEKLMGKSNWKSSKVDQLETSTFLGKRKNTVTTITSGSKNNTQDTIPEIIKILSTFYQVKELLDAVKVYKNDIDKYLEILSNIFTMDIFFDIFPSFCPGIWMSFKDGL